MKLYGRLSALASDLSGHGIDFKPTDQQVEVKAIFNKRLQLVNDNFGIFIKQEVPELNEQLKKSKLKIDTEHKIKM